MTEPNTLLVSQGPHLKSPVSIGSAMRDVMLALVPVTGVAIYFFRWYAVFLMVVCMVTAVLTELAFRAYFRKKPNLGDCSAVLTGMFVALTFSATTHWWSAAMATFIAVGLAKELMGGLGWNRFNPALMGRVALILVSPWMSQLNTSLEPVAANFGEIDILTHATPLAMLQQGMELPPYREMFFAFPGGAMSETSILALLIGGAWLIYREHINWRTPAAMLGAVAVGSLLLGKDPFYHLITGGLMMGAFFMATDWVTSPISDTGKAVFGLCIGTLVVAFRAIPAPTEGVAFSILIMNAFVPTIDRLTRRPVFGVVVKSTKPWLNLVRQRTLTR